VGGGNVAAATTQITDQTIAGRVYEVFIQPPPSGSVNDVQRRPVLSSSKDC
jgi:hypothetical protein